VTLYEETVVGVVTNKQIFKGAIETIDQQEVNVPLRLKQK